MFGGILGERQTLRSRRKVLTAMGKKILLADDSITIQKVIELTFSDEDFES